MTLATTDPWFVYSFVRFGAKSSHFNLRPHEEERPLKLWYQLLVFTGIGQKDIRYGTVLAHIGGPI